MLPLQADGSGRRGSEQSSADSRETRSSLGRCNQVESPLTPADPSLCVAACVTEVFLCPAKKCGKFYHKHCVESVMISSWCKGSTVRLLRGTVQ